MNWGNEMKMKKWSLQWMQLMQLCKEAWKKNSGLQRGSNPWPCDTGAMLYQLSYDATDVGSRSIVGSMFPWKKWVLMIYEINGLLMTFLWHSSTFIKTMSLMKCSCFKRLDQLQYSTWVSRFLVVWLLSRVK